MTRRKTFWHNRIYLLVSVIGCLMIWNKFGIESTAIRIASCICLAVVCLLEWSCPYTWEPLFRKRYRRTAKHISSVKELVLLNRNMVHEVKRQIRLSGKRADQIFGKKMYKKYLKLAEVYGFWLTAEKIDQMESEMKILYTRHYVHNRDDVMLLDQIDAGVELHNAEHEKNEQILFDMLKYIRDTEEVEESYAG